MCVCFFVLSFVEHLKDFVWRQKNTDSEQFCKQQTNPFQKRMAVWLSWAECHALRRQMAPPEVEDFDHEVTSRSRNTAGHRGVFFGLPCECLGGYLKAVYIEWLVLFIDDCISAIPWSIQYDFSLDS